jgi:flotillin
MSAAVWVTGAVLTSVLVIIPLVVTICLRDVAPGDIRIVTWLQGSSVIYRGPAKAKELPLLSSGTTIPGQLLPVELDLTEQTGDVDGAGTPRPVTVHVRATPLVSVGEGDPMIHTAVNHFFSMPPAEQTRTLADLLASVVREGLSCSLHDELFAVRAADEENGQNSGTPPRQPFVALVERLCARELADLGLTLRSLNLRSIESELADARRRQTAAAARAETAVVEAVQALRVREAQLDAERAISEKERELEQTRANNAALIAQATARQQEIRAKADAERVRIEADAAKEALRGAQFGLALDEALRITKIAAAQAEGFRKINDTIREGGDSYFRYRMIELLPQLTPAIAKALGDANLISSGDGSNGASAAATSGITSVIQGILEGHGATETGPTRPADGPGPVLETPRAKVAVRRRQRG